MVTVRKSKLLDVESNTYYFEFDVDTIAELPEHIYNGANVAHGSKARIINTGDVYRINGENVWRAQTSGGAGLPEVTSEDNGDVLTVVNGAWDKATPEKELPEVTSSDNGDVLTVVDGAWGKAKPNTTKIYTLIAAGGGVYNLDNGALMSDVYNDLANGVNVAIESDMTVVKKYLYLQHHTISQNVDEDIYYFSCYYYDSAATKMIFSTAQIKNTESATVIFRSTVINVP